MADTTTTLNPGAGGDLMDESSVIQADGITSAKRPRVVLGHDDGTLVNSQHPLPFEARETNAKLDTIIELLQQLIRLQGGIP